MSKQQLEIIVDENTDAFLVRNYLQSIRGIKKAYIVTCRQLHVYYDDNLIQPKIIAKAIGTVGRENGRKRLNNIVSMREIKKNAA